MSHREECIGGVRVLSRKHGAVVYACGSRAAGKFQNDNKRGPGSLVMRYYGNGRLYIYIYIAIYINGYL